MDNDELAKLIREEAREGAINALKDFQAAEKKSYPRKSTAKRTKKATEKKSLTVTHKLIYFASFVYFVVLVVSIVSWFMYREVPSKLLEYGTYLYGAAFAAYTGKSAYEFGKKYDPNYEEQDGV